MAAFITTGMNGMALSNENDLSDEEVIKNALQDKKITEEEAELIRKFSSQIEDLKKDPEVAAQCDPATIIRFLRARNLNMEKAEKMFRKSMEWRKEYKVEEKTEEYKADKSKEAEFIRSHWPVAVLNEDKEGFPFYVGRYGMCDMAGVIRETSLDLFIQSQIQTNASMFEIVHEKKKTKKTIGTAFVALLDMKGMQFTRAMNCMSGFGKIAKILDANFPERLKCCLIINCPWIFAAVYRVAERFLDEGTRNKIVIVAEGKPYLDRILEYIDISQVPEFFGGEYKLKDGEVPEGGTIPFGVLGKGPKKLKLSAGKNTETSTEEIAALDLKAGDVVTWEWSISGWLGADVVFSVRHSHQSYADNDPRQRDSITMIDIPVVERKKYSKHSGSYTVEQPGAMEFFFDNSDSMLRSKEIKFQMNIDSKSADEFDSDL